MSLDFGAVMSFLAVVVSAAFVLWGEIIRRRTPSVEKEAEQEDQWRKELWEINRTLSADLEATQKDLKATRKLLEQSEAQTQLLQQQCDMLKHEKEAWVIEREEMKAQIKGLKQDVFDLTGEMNSLKRAHAEGK